RCGSRTPPGIRRSAARSWPQCRAMPRTSATAPAQSTWHAPPRPQPAAQDPQRCSPALVTEAHGHALTADPRACAVALTAASQALDRSTPDCEPRWLQYFDAAYLAAKTGRALLDCGDPGQAAVSMRASLDMAGGFTRGRTFNLALLAGALFDAGQVDEGAAAGRQALEAADGIESARITGELASLASRASRHRSAGPVRELLPALPTGRRGVRALPAAR